MGGFVLKRMQFYRLTEKKDKKILNRSISTVIDVKKKCRYLLSRSSFPFTLLIVDVFGENFEFYGNSREPKGRGQ